jgi:hypothetical protein
MGKGLNKARNKQGELARKMELAKRQREELGPEGQRKGLTDEEIRERNDRLRFEEMLRSSTIAIGETDEEGYLSQSQEDVRAARRRIDRIFEGDPAPAEPFEELVSIISENAIGEGGASRLVPWLRKNPERRSDYLAILTDPRQKSPELREAIRTLSGSLPDEILDRMIVINADSPAENRRWLKKNPNKQIDIYSDEKLEWMRAYSALGEKRWSMTLIVIKDEKIQKLAREVDGIQVTRVVKNAINSLET